MVLQADIAVPARPTRRPARQTAIPCVLMRGGTSRGPFFLREDLPADDELMKQVLLRVMGSPHVRQIDGIGGSDPVTSKVAMVRRSTRRDADVDYLFAQVFVDRALVDTSPPCGNMVTAVGPFAIEHGLVAANDPETIVRIWDHNTQSLIEATVQTPGGEVTYDGDWEISGVNDTAAPIALNLAGCRAPRRASYSRRASAPRTSWGCRHRASTWRCRACSYRPRRWARRDTRPRTSSTTTNRSSRASTRCAL